MAYQVFHGLILQPILKGGPCAAPFFALAIHTRHRVPASSGFQPFGLASSTGPPAAFQALNPPATWATGDSPMSCAVLADRADRQPLAQ